MENKNTLALENIRKYKSHLSVVGQEILNVLIKKHNTGCGLIANTSQRISASSHSIGNKKKRVITFNPDKTDTEINLCSQIDNNTCLLKNNCENRCSYNAEGSNSLNVSTPEELLNVHVVHNKLNQLQTIRSDVLQTVENDNVNLHMKASMSYNTTFPNENEEMKASHRSSISTEKFNDEVSWNDMFDTELILNVAESSCSKYAFEEKNASSEPLKACMQNDNEKESKKCIKRNKKADQKEIVSKKVKMIDDRKQSCRKVPYKKAVGKWLQEVDLSNPIGIVTDSIENKDHSNEIRDINDAIEVKPARRVIQAQLVNKEGVMKFDKPKEPKNGSNKSTLLSDVSSNPKNTNIRNENTKKGKPKFVAPIKSNIPVKDIAYKIHVMNDKNCDELINHLTEGSHDICAVLVYSNNFCQLNKQYTEEDCLVDGIMLCENETFYYFSKASKIDGNTIKLVIQQNTITCFDGKNLLIFLISFFDLDINDSVQVNDTKIGGSLLEPDSPPESFSDLLKLLSVTPEFTVQTDCVLQKTAWYTTVLQKCALKLKQLLVEESLWDIFKDMEMPLVPIIAEMEYRGIRVDVDKLQAMGDALVARMKSVESECYKAAGKSFQINSTVQVRNILYEELQLDTKCNVKIKETVCQGAKSTSGTMLRSLSSKHPLPKLILEYRRLHKAHATFIAGVAQHVHNGILRPTWVQSAAATGRIACAAPNLQAVPKGALRLAADTPQDGGGGVCLRAAYVAGAGGALLAADFRQAECRVAAHVSRDAALARALARPADLFRALAALWLKKPIEEISATERDRTKHIVYASMYGAGARKLMDILDVTYEQALTVASSFNRSFPSLRQFGERVMAQCARDGGCVRTCRGRRRRLSAAQGDARATRQAINFVVQGTAADLCKTAMVRQAAALRAAGVDARLLLQIHDELVWDVARPHLRRAQDVIKEVMENCGHECGLDVRMPVALSSGDSWGELTPLEPCGDSGDHVDCGDSGDHVDCGNSGDQVDCEDSWASGNSGGVDPFFYL